jgi:PAS domain S-box-containing protein
MSLSPGRKVFNIVKNPGFWLIAILFILITIPHYIETLGYPTFFATLIDNLRLTRQAFERILFLAPIVWAGFIFDFKGAFITSIIALILMLPRVILISDDRIGAVFEVGSVFIVGNMLAITFDSYRHAHERRIELEKTQRELQASEQRYRSLFEDAHDGIFLQDMDGNIVATNVAASKLTGYAVSELEGMNVRQFLSSEALDIARDVRQKLLKGETIGESYDQKIKRKDGTEALVRLSSSLIRNNGRVVGFQHIGRDITEEKRLQENQRYYVQQVTRAQEEERKRISRELHDDTIQSLVALSRQLDALASNSKDLPQDIRQRVEELWQQTNNVMQGVRRLSQDLRPAALDRLGLLPALEWLTTDVTKFSGIPVYLTITGSERRLPEDVELALFRIVQEALRNVWRHSEATRADVTVEFTNYKVKITVSDNGKGFDLPKSAGDLAKDGKLGLAGMAERARLLGATLTSQSKTGKGTIIAVELAA